MIIFKNYLKVAKSMMGLLILYTGIFLAITVININVNSQNTTLDIDDIKVAVVNHDDSSIIKDFISYIKKETNYVTLDENEDNLKDALFYRKVDYIMIIPKNYTNDVLSNQDVHIKTMQVPDSYMATYSKELMNKYINTAITYQKVGIKESKINEYVKDDLSNQANVHIIKKTIDPKYNASKYYFSFSNYSFLAIIITIISMVITSFNEEKIKNRTMISPISYQQMNRSILLGNITVSVIVWMVYMIFAFIFYPTVMTTFTGCLYMLNSFIFVLFALMLAFLLSRLTNKRELISGVSNVIALGSSFIAGAFVPQEMLASSVIMIAKFTPSYWFIKNNELIGNLTKYTNNNLQPIFINMLVMLLFIIIVYIIINIISRLKLKR